MASLFAYNSIMKDRTVKRSRQITDYDEVLQK